MKHNKKRNTAFIYEVLTQELTKTIVNKDHERKKLLVSVLKEHFAKGTILAQELELYNTLLSTKNIQAKLAERMLHEVKGAHSLLGKTVIFDAQSKAIADINKLVGQRVWANFVSNFKSIASVNSIFNPKVSVKNRVIFEQIVIDEMSEKKNLTGANQMKPVDSLTYNSFIKKFNQKYDGIVQEQKDLLNRYITSFADEGLELRLYLNEELDRLKQKIHEIRKGEHESLVLQKVEEVGNYLEEFRHRDFTEQDISKILKTQEVVRELANNDHN